MCLLAVLREERVMWVKVKKAQKRCGDFGEEKGVEKGLNKSCPIKEVMAKRFVAQLGSRGERGKARDSGR